MNEGPVDLRTLADVEEPDVVREAVRTFRRRLLTRYVWITLAIALLTGAIWWAVQPSSLGERIDAATPRDAPGITWHTKTADIGLAAVTRLRDGVGLRFVVIAPADQAQNCIAMPASIDQDFPADGFDAYFEVPRSTTGVFQAQIGCDPRSPETITIDLPSMHVDDTVWKES